MQHRPLIIAHRGAQTDHPQLRNAPHVQSLPAENTLAAFDHALKMGADGLELDLIRTRDHQLAVIHSARLSDHIFYSPSPSYVTDCSLAELQTLRTGSRHNGIIPSLDDVLNLAAHFNLTRPVWLNLEIKDVKGTDLPRTTETRIDGLLAKTLAKNRAIPASQIVVSSFSHDDLQAMSSYGLGIRLGQLFAPSHSANEACLSATPDTIAQVHTSLPCLYACHIPACDITTELQQAIAQRQLSLVIWLDEEYRCDEPRLRRMLHIACTHPFPSALITNFPNQARACLR